MSQLNNSWSYPVTHWTLQLTQLDYRFCIHCYKKCSIKEQTVIKIFRYSQHHWAGDRKKPIFRNMTDFVNPPINLLCGMWGSHDCIYQEKGHSGMWRRVVCCVSMDILEDTAAFFFRVEYEGTSFSRNFGKLYTKHGRRLEWSAF